MISKKIKITLWGLLILLALISTGFYILDSLPSSRDFYLENEPCAFCQGKVVQQQSVYEGNLVRVLYNYKPLLEGHLLIIPKRNVSRFEDLTDAELIEMGQAIRLMQKVFQKQYHTNDYLLVLQNGPDAGQTVPHVHFHMIPRNNENTLIIKAKLWQAFLTEILGLRKPLTTEELKVQTERFHQTIDEVQKN